MFRGQYAWVLAVLSCMVLTACGQGGVLGSGESTSGGVENTAITPGHNQSDPCPQLNEERAKADLSPLESSLSIVTVAASHAADMASRGHFSHVSPEGVDMGARLKAGGVTYGWAGENIARGYADCEAVFNAWMNSSGHRANILNSHYRKYGLAVNNLVWVIDFTD